MRDLHTRSQSEYSEFEVLFEQLQEWKLKLLSVVMNVPLPMRMAMRWRRLSCRAISVERIRFSILERYLVKEMLRKYPSDANLQAEEAFKRKDAESLRAVILAVKAMLLRERWRNISTGRERERVREARLYPGAYREGCGEQRREGWDGLLDLLWRPPFGAFDD